MTHRGPIINHEDKDAASILFGGSLPMLKESAHYSL
jgi:hypothetical protein